jgi:shikimate kinase/3-dehydroquinate synthase
VEALKATDAPRALVFVGFMGAGKTTGARAAAAALGTRAIDADRTVEERLGSSIEAYFASHGERAFREVEEEVVSELLEAPPAPVISLGGGAVGSGRVRDLLRRHTVVLLDVDVETAWRRAGGRRPLARDRERFSALHAERAPLYRSLADAVLLDSAADTVRRAAHALRGLPSGVKLLWATAGHAQYPVYVGNILGGDFWPLGGRRFVVSDERVAALHGRAIAPAEATLTMPPGETAKTLATVETLLRGLARAGLARGDHVVALGGGVVGDVAGFCAAIYQRGVPVVQVPTTLVAQVDSAYGGKTGVDIPEGKNYAGAYHQPAAVLSDPRTLLTLPEPELAAGWAEVIKTALIAGGTLWERVRHDTAQPDRETILACARTKLAVVAEDERDSGRRQALNLGHTVGHAVETATGYARYRHGEAVGLGLLAALRLSGQDALRAQVRDLLAAAGLPVTLDPAVDPDAVVGATARDKKRTSAEPVGFVLLDAPGAARFGAQVPPGDVRAAVSELVGG